MGIIPTLNTFVAGTPIVASAMNSNFEAIVTVVNGGLDDSNILQISAEKVTSGVFDPDRIPRLSEDKLPRAAQGFLKAKGATADPAYELVQWGDVQGKPTAATRWPMWTEVTGKPSTFPPSAHTHGAGDITSGTFAPARIQSLFSSGGTPGTNRVLVHADKLSGRVSTDNMPTSSTANRFLKVGTANSSPAYSMVTWDDVQGKPSAFPPASHSHSWSSITSKPSTFPPSSHSHSWDSITGKPSTFPPSAHSADLLTSGTVPAARLPATISGSKTYTGPATFQHNATFSANTSFNGPVIFGTNGRLILPSSW